MENKRKSKSINLLLPALFAVVVLSGCGSNEDPQRDIYATRQECVQDWGDDELCEAGNDSDMDEYRRQHPNSVVYPYYILGPSYYSGDRGVVYKGRTIAPTTRSSTLAPIGVRSGSSIASRPSISSPRSVTYGGFGGTRGGSVGG